MSALDKMASIKEKYENLANQLEKAEDEMTPEQVARYMKITAKLAKAIE